MAAEKVMQSAPGPETVIDGRRYLYFAGTGYLGLQGHPEVIRAACDATRHYGIGSATTRAWFGNTPPTLDVERLAARLFAADEAFYYPSGYLGNHILANVLAERFDAVFVDERSHYSLLEGVRSSARPIFTFGYRDPGGLEACLRANLRPGQRPLVATDGIFPVLGTIAPLAEYRQVLAEYPGAMLMIDDAHAAGVLGANGRGTYEYLGLPADRVNRDPDQPAFSDGPALLFSATTSKALGGFGGILPGARAFVARVKSVSHCYDGASAPPVPAAAATARALELLMAQPEMRTRLWENARLLKNGLRRLGLCVEDTPVPIVGLAIGDGPNMQRIQQTLVDRGIMIAHAASYSGLGPGGALRIAVFSTHTPPMIEQLVDAMAKEL